MCSGPFLLLTSHRSPKLGTSVYALLSMTALEAFAASASDPAARARPTVHVRVGEHGVCRAARRASVVRCRRIWPSQRQERGGGCEVGDDRRIDSSDRRSVTLFAVENPAAPPYQRHASPHSHGVE